MCSFSTKHYHHFFENCGVSLHATNSICHYLIPRLHDQAGSTSCYVLAGRASSMFAQRLLYVCPKFARCLLDDCFVYAMFHVCFIFARCLIDVCLTFARCLFNVCSMFARSCKQGVIQPS